MISSCFRVLHLYLFAWLLVPVVRLTLSFRQCAHPRPAARVNKITQRVKHVDNTVDLLKRDFAIFNPTTGTDSEHYIYFDSAATSQQPTEVTSAMNEYINHYRSNVNRGSHRLSSLATEKFEQSRTTVQKFIHATSNSEIVFTSGATHALNQVAFGWGRKHLNPGDEIILSVLEHHSNLLPWQAVGRDRGADIKYIGLTSHMDFDYESFLCALNKKTKVVSLCQTSNVLGSSLNIKQLAAAIRSQAPQAVFVVDGCQSTPHQPIDVQDMDCDFFCFSGHKLCGPTGVGVLYGKQRVLEDMSPLHLGGGMARQVTIDPSTSLNQLTTSYQPIPHCFEAGTPAIAEVIGLDAAVKYLTRIGMDNIRKHNAGLGQYLFDGLQSIPGIRVIGPSTRSSGIVAFTHESIHPADITTLLDSFGIAVRAGQHCAQPLHSYLLGDKASQGSVRASMYLYNSKPEVDIFLLKLKETIAFFQR